MEKEQFDAIMKELGDIKQQLNNIEQRLPMPVMNYGPTICIHVFEDVGSTSGKRCKLCGVYEFGQIVPDKSSGQITMDLPNG